MNKRRSESLREALEEMIAMGELAPGQHLDESELAARFGVSRTPIREALIQLDAEGIIQIRPRRGAVVAQASPARLVEMFEVMAELESMCARLAARRMDAADHLALQAAHRACQASRDARDPDEYYYRNEAFHRTLYAGSRNQFLIEEAERLHRRLRPYRRLQLRVRDRVATSYGEHEAIVQALLAGDAEQSARLARDHVLIQGQRFADLIASLPQR
ncbi:GntR family transcriptional regulator [Orrella sp. JC864]|uniref:GntR family transcriptional regulator n=1 Tax=Orrella sp. JC864 TaxID=3120298 RepID=UPI00300AAD09